jgi:hypothetical protein
LPSSPSLVYNLLRGIIQDIFTLNSQHISLPVLAHPLNITLDPVYMFTSKGKKELHFSPVQRIFISPLPPPQKELQFTLQNKQTNKKKNQSILKS